MYLDHLLHEVISSICNRLVRHSTHVDMSLHKDNQKSFECPSPQLATLMLMICAITEANTEPAGRHRPKRGLNANQTECC